MRSAVLQYMGDFFAQHKAYAFGYAILSFATPLGEVVLPYFYGKIIQNIADKKPIAKYVIIVAVLWIVVQVMFGIMDKLDASIVPDMQAYLRNRVVGEILEANVHQSDDVQIGKIIDRLTKLPVIVTDLFVETRYYVLPALYVMIFANAYFYYVSPILGAITTLLIVLFFSLLYTFRNTFHNSEMSAKQSELSEQIGDILENLNSIYSSGTLGEEKTRMYEKDAELKDATKRTYKKANHLKYALNAFYVVVFLTINGYSYFLYKKDKIPLSSLSSVFIIVLYMLGQFVTVSGEITSIIQNMSVVDDVHEYVESLKVMRDEDANRYRAPETSSKGFDPSSGGNTLNGAITLKNVSSSIEGKPIFKDLNLNIPARTKVCLFGKVGSGKTTLINLVMGYRAPDSGEILFDGRKIDCNLARANISYVKQNHRLFDRSLCDNITYGTRSGAKLTPSEVREILREHGLETVFGNHNLEDPIGKNGCHLSGGQRQIVAILRAMIRDRPIVILDEPTSAMDEGMRDIVINFAKTAFVSKTVLFITHDSHIRATYGFDRTIDVATLRV